MAPKKSVSSIKTVVAPASAIILLFSCKDDLDSGWLRASQLELDIAEQLIPCRLINKLCSNFDELLLVAQHRVITTPMSLVVRGREELFRKVGLTTARSIVEQWKRLAKVQEN